MKYKITHRFETLVHYAYILSWISQTVLYEVADHSAEPRQPCWSLLN